MTGYNSTATLEKVTACDKNRTEPGVFGLDCEMIYTTLGFELARVTVVNDLYDVVLDKFVKPAGRLRSNKLFVVFVFFGFYIELKNDEFLRLC